MCVAVQPPDDGKCKSIKDEGRIAFCQLHLNMPALFSTVGSADCVIAGLFVVAMYKDLVARETGKNVTTELHYD